MTVHLAKRNQRSNHVRDDVVRARVNANLKKDVEKILHSLGLSMSEAISLYLAQVKLANGVPFDIKIPNKITQKAMHDAEIRKTKKVKNTAALFEEID